MFRQSSASAAIVQGAADLIPVLPAVGRCALAILFLISGFGKLGAPEATILYIASSGLPLPQVGLVIAILMELGGGLLLVLGFCTRPVAAALAAFTVATAVFFHSNLGDQGQFIQFLKNIAITGGLLQVVAFGAGRFSIDARRSIRNR